MSEKRQVSIRDFVHDVRSGLADLELMAKYNLSAKGVHRAFQKLVEIGAITQGELDARSQPCEDTIFFKSMREVPRHYLVIPIPIHDTGRRPQESGMIRDITEKGIGISGIDAAVGETRTFSIFPNEFMTVGRFSFKAVCRWTERRGVGDFVGGFQITEIAPDSLEKLRQMIRELTFGES